MQFPPLVASLIGSKIGGATAGFTAPTYLGSWLLVRGYHDDLRDTFDDRYAPRWSIFVAGALLQLPLPGWIVFLNHQGWFDTRRPINFFSY